LESGRHEQQRSHVLDSDWCGDRFCGRRYSPEDAMKRLLTTPATDLPPRTADHPGWIDERALAIARQIADEAGITDVQYIARIQIGAIEGIKAALPADLSELRRLSEVEVLAWAKSKAWYQYGIAWRHLEKISQEELLEQVRTLLAKGDGQ
jgi:hypothetical protein